MAAVLSSLASFMGSSGAVLGLTCQAFSINSEQLALLPDVSVMDVSHSAF